MNYNLEEMTPKDIEKIIKFLQELLVTTYERKNTISKVVKQENDNVTCPYCNQSDWIIKNGFTKNKVQRYLCKKCNRRFIISKDTLCYHSKLSFGDWKLYFECMSDGLSIRKTAAKMSKNKNTIFCYET